MCRSVLQQSGRLPALQRTASSSLRRPHRAAAVQLHRSRPPARCSHVTRVGPLKSVNRLKTMMEGAARNYDKYDKNKDGLDIDECLALLNGDELKKTLENMGIEHRVRTKEDIEGKFGDADADGNGRLSRTEFMSLYAGLVRERVSADPRLVALALCSALDTNGDGALDGRELRKVLKLVVPMMPVAGWMVPPGARVEYRKVFGDVKDDEK